MNRKQAGIGLGVGVAAFVGLIALSGQYVPPTGSVPALTTGGGLVITSGKVGLTTACSEGERLEWDGDSWECRLINDYRSATLFYENDFLNGASTSWDAASANGASSSASTVGIVTGISRPGYIWLQTGSTSTGRAARDTASLLLTSAMFTSATYESVLAPHTLSDGTERWAGMVGFLNSESAVNQTAGCYFLVDEGNVATGGCNSGNLHKLQAFAVNSSTRTRVMLDGTAQDGACSAGAITTCDTTVAAASGNTTGWMKLKVVMTANSCAFYVNDALCTTLTTNIPSSTSTMGADTAIIKSIGNTDRYWLLDKHSIQLMLAAPRG